jgi:hypothetical protein
VSRKAWIFFLAVQLLGFAINEWQPRNELKALVTWFVLNPGSTAIAFLAAVVETPFRRSSHLLDTLSVIVIFVVNWAAWSVIYRATRKPYTTGS